MKRIAIVLVALMTVFIATGCGGRVELLHEISESEANEAIAALLNAGISSSKIPGKEGLVNLDVDQNQVAHAISILGAEGLPRERFAKMGDIFKKEGLISSPLEERARYIWALSQELSATLSQIDGVIKARVHVVLPEKPGGGEPSLPSSAAVFIKHKPKVNLEDSVSQIKRLVSNSIPGLSSDKVTVVMLTSVAPLQKNETEIIGVDGNGKKAVEDKSAKSNFKTIFLAFSVASLVIAIGVIYLFLGYHKSRKEKKSGESSQVSTSSTI